MCLGDVCATEMDPEGEERRFWEGALGS